MRSAKDKSHLENHGIYEIPYGNYDRIYVGHTNCRINEYAYEYMFAVECGLIISAITQYSTCEVL